MSKKNKVVIIDVHKTLLNEDGTVNENLYKLIDGLNKSYTVHLVTGRYYDTVSKFQEDIKPLLGLTDAILSYNKHDIPNEDFKLQYAVKLSDTFKYIIAIDNNKKVIKKLREAGFDTLKYKCQE